MRKYFATLHKRSDAHKKRFALLSSGGFTLVIFAVWAAVNFGGSGNEAAASAAKSSEVGPLQVMMENIKDSFNSLFTGIKSDLQSVEIQSGYEEMKSNALNIYGRE